MYSRSLSILHDSSVHKFAYATQIASTYIGRLDRFTRDIEVSCMLFFRFFFFFFMYSKKERRFDQEERWDLKISVRN